MVPDNKRIMPDGNRESLRWRALLITALAMVVVYLLWNIPQLTIVLYPLRLFTTYVHEAGHSLAAILTGGSVVGFAVSANGSGLATTIGGTRWLILPAGYLGAALFGSLLYYLVNRFPRVANAAALTLGLGMILFTLLFARPDETGTPVALFIGVGFGTILLLIGLQLNGLMTLLVLNVLAVSTALEAVMDLRYLINFASTARRGTVMNDAAAFSSDIMPLLPPSAIALTWAGMAVIMLGLAVYYGTVRPIRHKIDANYSRLT
jgi:hypothetical protein